MLRDAMPRGRRQPRHQWRILRGCDARPTSREARGKLRGLEADSARRYLNQKLIITYKIKLFTDSGRLLLIRYWRGEQDCKFQNVAL